jgi:3-oxoacyl-[acyl-carrier protein] reductase
VSLTPTNFAQINLEGRVALVTGGNRGIGYGCAMALARAGADLAITYRRGAEDAHRAVEEIKALGRRALAVQCDVSVESDVASMISAVLEHFGMIDILICNAGIASRGYSVHDTTTEEMRKVIDTHVFGTFWCVRAALDSMRNQGRGDIILISSIATTSCGERTAPYTMAKSAIESLTRILSKEEGPNGIRVNCIGPGLIETEMGRRLVKGRSGTDIKDLYATFPFGRVGQPEDIGNLAAFLCSDAAEYISGQVIYVHGGGFQRHQVV